MRTRAVLALRYFILSLFAAVSVLLVGAVGARSLAPATVTTLPLPYSGPGDGGWSGIDVSADGTRFWVVTDRGKRTEGTLLRDQEGTLTAIDAPRPVFLPGLRGPRIGEYPDAEGIVVDDFGARSFVAFEGFTRLRSYDPDWTRAAWIPDPPDARLYHHNRGFEGVARDSLGRLYTLPERPLQRGAPFPLYRFTKRAWMGQGDWTIATWITSEPGWYAVGADFGPEGQLFVLERRFHGIGFASRVRRFDVVHAVPSATLTGQIVYRSGLGQHGNLEGIGIWRDPEGRLRAVMVSDDNMRAYQRAEMVEVILAPVAPPPG